MDTIQPNTFPFPILIVNLDRSPDRYNYITYHLNSLGITGCKRWSATDGSKTYSAEMIEESINIWFIREKVDLVVR